MQLVVVYVLFKTLPPVCMKYTAQDESRVANIALVFGVANIARGEAECYICHKTLSSRAVYFHTNKVAVFEVFYCILH